MNNGLPVAGYVPQTDDKIDLVNANKIIEERMLRQIEKVRASGIADERMCALAFTGVQEAMMWLNRSVFQPTRVALPEDLV